MKRIILALTLLIGSFTERAHCSFLANIPTGIMNTATKLWRNAATLGVGLPAIGSFLAGLLQNGSGQGVVLVSTSINSLGSSILLGTMTKAIDPSDKQGLILYCSTGLLIHTAAWLLGRQAGKIYNKLPDSKSEDFLNSSQFQKKAIRFTRKLVRNPFYAGTALMALAACSALYYGSKS
jgi:hypothetical protein